MYMFLILNLYLHFDPVAQVDTRNPSKPEQGSWLSMAVLMSYKGMGVAALECARNCECRPMTIDALWSTRMSIKARARVSRGIVCRLPMG